MQTQQPGADAAERADRRAGGAPRGAAAQVSVRSTAPIVYTLHSGALVYPTGERNGIWMEVDDENGNRGWMSSAYSTPR